MSWISRRVFIASLSSAPYAFSKLREEPVFPAWSPEFVDRMLTDSPWAKQGTVSFELEPVQHLQSSSYTQIGIPGLGWPTGRSTGSGGAASSVRTEIYLTTRWSSALPIRRAIALQDFGADGLQSDKAFELLNRQPTEYVIEIAGFPATMIRQGANRFEAELLRSARLLVKDRTPMRATSAHVPEYGNHLVATLRFPRWADLSAREGTIDVTAQSGRMSIRERFKLKDMVYGGNLEL